MQHRSPPPRRRSLPRFDLASSVRQSIGSWWSRLSCCALPDGEWAQWRAARFAVSEAELAVSCRLNSGSGGAVAVGNHRGESSEIGPVRYVGSRGRR